MIHQLNDTIAAIATPVGIGGISVIRVSGPDAVGTLDQFFRGKARLKDVAPQTIHFGSFHDRNGDLIDTVLVSVFISPHSYTGDDVCEINCHGGYYIAESVLSELYRYGIRPAEPGEFTYRAFINGKLDLAQAEAVADIIHAKSERSHKASIEQLRGRLSRYSEALRHEILDICSLLELELDFSQEGIEIADKTVAIQKLSSIAQRIELMLLTYTSGKYMREGIKVALVGKPNAGKSSVLNFLLEEERSIVSHIPGTTRDTIEETVILNGLEFVFTDTAGLRETGDIIELEGIKRTSATIQSSDIVCTIVDSSIPVSAADLVLYKNVQALLPTDSKKIFLFNKCDVKDHDFDKSVQGLGQVKLYISCKSGEGMENFKNTLINIAIPGHDSVESAIMINNSRHKTSLEHALEGIKISIESLKNGMSDEFVAVDLRRAVDYLGEIIGLTTPDDVLNNIFSKFCIGK